MKTLTAIFLGLCLSISSFAQQTESLYLSGKGLYDTKTWQFRVSDGANSGSWKTIEVPSQWELQGYGQYNYGRMSGPRSMPIHEYGEYKYTFKVPSSWRGGDVKIVFEGAMTDTQVKINGKIAGPTHQGGFYTFEYNITDLVKYGANNKLEVLVKKESDNPSVNSAERHADWWNFGGIYRPVYLTRTAKEHIEHFAIDARANGSMTVDIEVANAPAGSTIRYSLSPLDAPERIINEHVVALDEAKQRHTLNWGRVQTWDCENPNLYVLKMSLVSPKGKVLHEVENRVGFRTVEFRPKDGLYVNGTKVVLKGVNRHVFHPEGGRCVNDEISMMDAKLIKQMNMNAVRSHYPPEKRFLEVCDSLGIFYLDELAGWHGRYDDQVGSILVREMVRRDVNHPSIIIWDNGNEGGWNTNLDKLFYENDPQKRHVIHPWADFDDLDTHHYPTYLTGVARFNNGYKVFMPTEFMHTNSDQGGGAGLEDFWLKWTSHPLFAGGFIWAFVDEAVVRVDQDGILDSNWDMGNDGVVGPYREKEGSFWAIRNVWSPIQFAQLYITPSFNGEFYVTNKYLFTNLDECKMEYRLKKVGSPADGATSVVTASGSIKMPSVVPNTTGIMRMEMPEGFFANDILELEAFDKHGESICTWTWPIHYASEYFQRHNPITNEGAAATVATSEASHTLSAKGISVSFNAETGELGEIKVDGKISPFGNMRPIGIKTKFIGGTARQDGKDAIYVAKYHGAVDSIVWRMTPDGKLGMDIVLLNRDNGGVRGGFDDGFMETEIKDLGFAFDFPKENVKGMKWLGKGPYRVWKNRLKGHNIDLWEKAYNETITGRAIKGKLEYPEFKGYHANIYWAQIQSDENPLTIYSEEDGLYLKVYNPDEPAMKFANLFPDMPEGDINLLLDIQAIKSFKSIPQQGPQSQPGNIRIKSGDEGLKMTIWFDFR
ncbi:MAG: beta-galactosidase [Bacteroidales bacterium]|nr:beta-galactosidase [Bacteroidales bacterium]